MPFAVAEASRAVRTRAVASSAAASADKASASNIKALGVAVAVTARLEARARRERRTLRRAAEDACPATKRESRRRTRPSFAPRRPRGEQGGSRRPDDGSTSYAKPTGSNTPRAPGEGEAESRRTRLEIHRAATTTSTRCGLRRARPCRTRGSRDSSSASLPRRNDWRSTRCCDARSNASSPKRPAIASPSRTWSSGGATPRIKKTPSSTWAPPRCARRYGTSRARRTTGSRVRTTNSGTSATLRRRSSEDKSRSSSRSPRRDRRPRRAQKHRRGFGKGSAARRRDAMLSVLRRASPEETKYFVRTLVRNMRVGANRIAVLAALAEAAEARFRIRRRRRPGYDGDDDDLRRETFSERERRRRRPRSARTPCVPIWTFSCPLDRRGRRGRGARGAPAAGHAREAHAGVHHRRRRDAGAKIGADAGETTFLAEYKHGRRARADPPVPGTERQSVAR